MVQQQGGGPGGPGPINVDVSRATVQHAEVTRMSMTGQPQGSSEDLLDEIKRDSSGSIKDHLSSIEKAVQDCCSKEERLIKSSNRVLANEIRKLGDILRGAGPGPRPGPGPGPSTDITEALGEQNKTLDALNENIRVLITTITTQGGGGGGDGGGDGGGGGDRTRLAESEQQRQQIQALNNAFLNLEQNTDGTSKIVIGWKKTLEDGTEEILNYRDVMMNLTQTTILTNTVGAFNNLVETLKDTISELTDLKKTTKETVEVMKQGIEATRTGLVTAGRFFVDDWNQLWEGAGAILTGDFNELGDSIKNTLVTLEAAREAEGLGITSQLINQTESLDQLGGYMKEARSELFKGNQLRQMMNDQEANAAIIEQLAIQRRAGVMGEISASELAMEAQKRAETLTLIAANTGATVGELMKRNKEAAKTFKELFALGAISKQQLRNFENIEAELGPMAEYISRGGEVGFNMSLFAAQNQELYERFARANMIPQLEELFRVAREESGGEYKNFQAEMKRAMNAIGDGATEFKKSFGDTANLILDGQQGFFAEVGASARTMSKLDQSINNQDSWLAQTWASVKSFFDNMFPGGSTGLAVAIGANTVALWANTAAHSGMVGKLAKAVGPMLLMAGKIVGVVAIGAAIGATIGMILNKVYNMFSKFFGGAGSLGSDLYDWWTGGKDNEIISENPLDRPIAERNKTRAQMNQNMIARGQAPIHEMLDAAGNPIPGKLAGVASTTTTGTANIPAPNVSVTNVPPTIAGGGTANAATSDDIKENTKALEQEIAILQKIAQSNQATADGVGKLGRGERRNTPGAVQATAK